MAAPRICGVRRVARDVHPLPWMLRNGMAAVLDLLEKRAKPKAPQLTGLTVGDVIAMLETFDPSAPVMVHGESGGFEEVLGFRTTGVALNVNS